MYVDDLFAGLDNQSKSTGHMLVVRERTHLVCSITNTSCTLYVHSIGHCRRVVCFWHANDKCAPIQGTLIYLSVIWAQRLQMRHCLPASLSIQVVRKLPALLPYMFFCMFVIFWWFRIVRYPHLWPMIERMFYVYWCNSTLCRDARVMWDQKTGRSRGFGFVSFRNQQVDSSISLAMFLLLYRYTPSFLKCALSNRGVIFCIHDLTPCEQDAQSAINDLNGMWIPCQFVYIIQITQFIFCSGLCVNSVIVSRMHSL